MTHMHGTPMTTVTVTLWRTSVLLVMYIPQEVSTCVDTDLRGIKVSERLHTGIMNCWFVAKGDIFLFHPPTVWEHNHK